MIIERKRNILLCIAGMSPQIITLTLFALTQHGEKVDEIRVITTFEGRNRILETLLNKGNGKFYEFCKDFAIESQSIKFDETTIYSLNKPDGTKLEDIRTPEENELVGDQIVEIVREICKDDSIKLHASVAGGRKTMSIHLTTAMQLFGRANDTLSHVLANKDFETNRDFFYPPPIPKLIRLRDGRKISTSKAEVYLSTIPFIRLRHDIDRQSIYESTFIKYVFSFPNEIKFPCEQYLLYFAQFLQDLGINATSNLKEEAGKVLFSVTPTDDIEALDKIREALAVYLNLPSSPIVYDESFAAMRLQQQVENLQHSQKMAVREIRSAEREMRLAQTVIEHQDKIIVQKDSIIEQQNKVIEKIQSKSIMMDSLENKEEFEKVFDGLEFGESKELKEKLGIKFNPITSLKSLGKQFIGKGEEITSLNLNSETNDKDI
jgi:CRISPR-associated protein (TIGR02584 family)